jgi:hypothetical protein
MKVASVLLSQSDFRFIGVQSNDSNVRLSFFSMSTV